jgi:adenine-specific DNA methylase
MQGRKEIEELIDIIKNVMNVDITKKTNERIYVDGRMVFSKILTDRGYGIAILGRALKKHHSSIIHYRTSANDLLDTNELFAQKYFACKDKFMSDKQDVFKISNKEQLLNQIDALILDRNALLKEVQKHKRLKNIIEYIDKRTPNGKESLVLRKINLMFNGITNYDKELEW